MRPIDYHQTGPLMMALRDCPKDTEMVIKLDGKRIAGPPDSVGMFAFDHAEKVATLELRTGQPPERKARAKKAKE